MGRILTISTTRRGWEIAAIAGLALGRLLFMVELEWRLPFITAVIFGIGGYVWYRLRRLPELRRYWGLEVRGFRSSWLRLLPVAGTLVAAFFGYGWYFGTEISSRTHLSIQFPSPSPAATLR